MQCLSCDRRLSKSGDHITIYQPTRDDAFDNGLRPVGTIHRVCPKYRFSAQTREILQWLVIAQCSEKMMRLYQIPCLPGIDIAKLPSRSVTTLVGRGLAIVVTNRVAASANAESVLHFLERAALHMHDV